MARQHRSGCSSFKKCARSTLALTFSTLGLSILVVSYTVIGGMLFCYLEKDHEELKINNSRKDAENKTEIMITKLYSLTVDSDPMLYHPNWTEQLSIILKEYQRDIYDITKNGFWDGKAPGERVTPQWSIEGSVLYAVTAITTIGYGHVTPKTVAGQALTIVYCIIGLPLAFMYLAKLGKVFAFMFRVIYHTCCCAVCCLACMARRRMYRRSIQKQSSDDDTVNTLFISKDSSNKSGTIVVGGKSYKRYTLGQLWAKRIKSNYHIGLQHESAVPTYVCLLVMAAYITAGAVLFASVEKHWDLWEGAYFCFITLTTIGFGDFVPGVEKFGVAESGDNESYLLILCAFYLMMGLAFIAMCIDLMQIDVANKLKQIGRVLGLSDSKHKRTHTDRQKEMVGLKLSSDTTPTTLTNSAMSYPNNLDEEAGKSVGPTLTRVTSSQSVPATPRVMTTSLPSRLFSYPGGRMPLERAALSRDLDIRDSRYFDVSCDSIDVNSNLLELKTSKRETNI